MFGAVHHTHGREFHTAGEHGLTGEAEGAALGVATREFCSEDHPAPRHAANIIAVHIFGVETHDASKPRAL